MPQNVAFAELLSQIIRTENKKYDVRGQNAISLFPGGTKVYVGLDGIHHR